MLSLLSLLRPRFRQSKPGSKQKYTNDLLRDGTSHRSFTHVVDEEREQILSLRRQGLSTHEIAGQVNRSTRTVNKVLRETGHNSRHHRQQQAEEETGNHHDTRTERPQRMDRKTDLKAELEQKILENALPTLQQNPELMAQVVMKLLGVTVPQKTLEEAIDEEVANNPEYRRRMAAHRVLSRIRDGRSEMEIVEDGLNQLIRLVSLVDKGQWARAFQSLGESGELSKTIGGAIAGFRGVPAGDAVSHPTAEPRPDSEPPGTSPSPPPSPSVDHAPSPVPIRISGRAASIRRRVSPEQLEEIIASIPMFSRHNGTGAEHQNPVPGRGNDKAAITDQDSESDMGESS